MLSVPASSCRLVGTVGMLFLFTLAIPDTTVSQLLVELELKDLKTGIHSAPGYSLFGH
ncbi:hypothetical protein M3981_001684 [Escherichia coli]|nr:hypothetical protein [Escherichia coli]HBM8363428.1 hypothetical protein [Escherichia coli]